MKSVCSLVPLLLALAAPAAAQQRGQAWWFYLDPISARCVPIDVAFAGAETPDQLQRGFPNGPWRIERKPWPQAYGEEAALVSPAGRYFRFYSNQVLCNDMRQMTYRRR